MTDKEIEKTRELLVKAGKLLGEYKAIAQLVADELAMRRSEDMFGNKDSGFGHLGNMGVGIDTICLETNSNVPIKSQDAHIDKIHAWEKKNRYLWAGIKNIDVVGYS